MKTIALFGATGKTGRVFIQQALTNGYRVKALARDPRKILIENASLSLFQGDILVRNDVEKIIEGSDIVVCMIGHVKGSPEWLQTRGMENIVVAMKKYGVSRVISLTGGAVSFPGKDKPKFADILIRTIMKIVVPRVLKDAVKHHKVLESGGVKWTIIRAPILNDKPGTGNYRVGWVGVNSGMKISREDLVNFMLKQVEEETYNFQMPFVSQ